MPLPYPLGRIRAGAGRTRPRLRRRGGIPLSDPGGSSRPAARKRDIFLALTREQDASKAAEIEAAFAVPLGVAFEHQVDERGDRLVERAVSGRRRGVREEALDEAAQAQGPGEGV